MDTPGLSQPSNQEWASGVDQGYSNAAAELLRVLGAHPAEPVGESTNCPTCNGRQWINGQWVANRVTVGMVCQTCGHDYAAEPVGVTSQQEDACTCPNFAGFCTAHFAQPVRVSDEAVERVAAKLYPDLWAPDSLIPEVLRNSGRWQRRHDVRAALEAAAPLMGATPRPTREAIKLALLNTWNDMAWDVTPFDPMQQIDQFVDAVLALMGGAGQQTSGGTESPDKGRNPK